MRSLSKRKNERMENERKGKEKKKKKEKMKRNVEKQKHALHLYFGLHGLHGIHGLHSVAIRKLFIKLKTRKEAFEMSTEDL